MHPTTVSSDILARAIELRRHLHRNPELSFCESSTQEYICRMLDSAGITYERVAGTGVLARITGGGDSRQAVVLRADIDALPITEQTGLEYASCRPGVMHACGHDMHAAALYGALLHLQSHKEQVRGTVFGLFQPGEELCPGGTTHVLAGDHFKGYDIRTFIGQHVDPELPTGVFGFRAGKYMASSDELRITVRGRGGHGALPEKLADPIPAAAALITALQQVVSRKTDPKVPTVLSIGRVIADGATNIIPDTVYMEGTFRTFDELWRERGKEQIRRMAFSICEAHGVEAEVEIVDGYPCVVNDEGLTAKAIEVFREKFSSRSVRMLDLRPTAEDFGYYTQIYPSLFYRFGVGGPDSADRTPSEGKEDASGNIGPTRNAGSLHTPLFAPDENALAYGIEGLIALAGSL